MFGSWTDWADHVKSEFVIREFTFVSLISNFVGHQCPKITSTIEKASLNVYNLFNHSVNIYNL